jgi:hypothetical protein
MPTAIYFSHIDRRKVQGAPIVITMRVEPDAPTAGRRLVATSNDLGRN